MDAWLKQQIIELETENMAPILKASGLDFDPEVLRKSLDDPQKVVTIIEKDQLVALLRYSIDKDLNAWVMSIQIRSQEKNEYLLLSLLKKTFKDISGEIKKITSVVQKANTRSLSLHKKLGFKITKEFDKAISLECEFKTLERKFCR